MPTPTDEEGAECEPVRERLCRAMLAELGFALDGDVLDVGAVRELSRTRLVVLVDSDSEDEPPSDPDMPVTALVVEWDGDAQEWLLDEPEESAEFDTLADALEWASQVD